MALGIDPWFMVRLGLLEYYPEVHAVIEKVLPTPILTKNEEALIKSFREVTDYSDPEFRFHGGDTKIVASYFVNKPASTTTSV